MKLRYFRPAIFVIGIFYILHCLLVIRGFSHVGLLVGFFFSLAPLAGPLAGFFYLVQPDEIGGVAAIAIQVLVYGYLMACHPLYRKRWTGIVSGAGALLWCLSGFFYVYALAT